MASYRWIGRMAVVTALLILATLRPAQAQWGHGSYSVTVNSFAGNYIVGYGANGGTVEADFPTSPATQSFVNATFTVAWNFVGPPPWSGTIRYKGDLSGSAGTGSSAKSQVSTSDFFGGTITKDTASSGNPFSITGLTCLTNTITYNSWSAKIDGYAQVIAGTGTSGTASGYLYTTMN